MLKKKDLKKETGITLVALVITILILLLLSMATIQFAMNNFGGAERAVTNYDKAQADEEIETAKVGASINQEGKINKEQLIKELHELNIKDEDITDNGNELQVKYKGNTYDIPYNVKLISVKVGLYDYINEEEVETVELKLLETTPLNESTVTMPEGYVLYSKHDSSITNPTVVIENGVADKSEYTLNVCKENKDGEILLKNSTGLRNIEKKLDDKYALDNDIDLESVSNWTPIGMEQKFLGVFNGNGYTVSNLKCDFSSSRQIGLISVNSGTIKNLNVSTATIKGSAVVGAICGNNVDGAAIENCHVSGSVTSTSTNMSTAGAAGGIAGSNYGTIRKCSAQGIYNGYKWTGGITGKNFGSISESYFIGGVNSNIPTSEIREWFSNVTTNMYQNIGGIAGGNTGSIENSYAILKNLIKGATVVGGICGWCKGGSLNNIYIANTCNIIGLKEEETSEDVGYISGNVYPTYSNLYAYNTTSTGLTSLPSGLSSSIWKMNGATYSSCPDLINNPR